MRTGFICSDGHVVKPNKRIATALSLEANLGLRISDILQLRLSDIIRDGDRYRLDIVEQKTKKKREFTVPTDIYIYIQNYALENNINPVAKLFDMSERAVNKHLKLVCDYLGFSGIGSHSFRKYFASLIGRIKQLIAEVLLFLVRKIVLLRDENANDLQIEIIIFTS